METKKNPSKDLERLSPAFFKFGLAIALGVVLLAFNVRKTERGGPIFEPDIIHRQTDELPPIIRLPEPKPPQVQNPQIKIVDDEEKVEAEPDLQVDVRPDYVVPEYVPLPVKHDEPEAPEDRPFEIVEDMPSYKGGEEARLAFLRDNLRYPNNAREIGIQGAVYVSFIVERDGSITNVEILRGIGGGCDEETLRVAKLMPKWNPGKQRNRPVRTYFRMPVRFALQ
jgi:protein TonB